ncbi:MAG: dTDP-4-dehydrorhamnose reductase [Lachnospiraceae bacterium]|nr:dTDP-4-dehydrorhamnose reductase [Lachnospiraceae bacterium]
MGYDYGRIWVVGAYGRVGSTIRDMLDIRKVELLETDVDDVDITDVEAVTAFAQRNRPNTIINCAGMTDMEACEKDMEQAYRVNALGARNLSAAARKVKALMIQLSTDDVFYDGKRTLRNEFDQPNPVTIYGKSKLAGENFVKELTPKHLIIRSSWVYGRGKNFVNYILEESRKSDIIQIPDQQYASPTSAKELARCVLRLIKSGQEGVFHAVCQGDCSRMELAQEILDMTGREQVKLVPRVTADSDMGVTIPEYTILDTLMLRMCRIEPLQDWRTALQEYIREKNNEK